MLPREDLCEHLMDPLLVLFGSGCMPAIQAVELNAACISTPSLEQRVVHLPDFLVKQRQS